MICFLLEKNSKKFGDSKRYIATDVGQYKDRLNIIINLYKVTEL